MRSTIRKEKTNHQEMIKKCNVQDVDVKSVKRITVKRKQSYRCKKCEYNCRMEKTINIIKMKKKGVTKIS